MEKYLLLLCAFFIIYVNISNGCTINGVTQWLEPQHFEMKDTHRGLIISQTTSNIEGISLTNFADGLNRGPYLELALINSVLTITAKDEFAEYEEHETLLSIRVTVTFNCVGGTTRPLTYVFNIIDTNNHAPVFRPSDSYEFPLALPVPPEFRVSGCDYMIVRDIDLTTSRIDFEIQDNAYFEIVYFGQIQPKEFGAYVRTKTLITSLPETMSLEITATDVDATNDDPLSSKAMMKIVSDNAFRLPDSLIFSAAFYEADYTESHNLILREEHISLLEGYDDKVKFRIQSAYEQYLNLVNNNNQIWFEVITPLPKTISESQIFVVVIAEREFTNAASATVIVHLPKARELSFKEPSYRGSIENNEVSLENIVLEHGYTSDINFLLSGEFSSYFTANNTDNLVTIGLRSDLPENVLLENNALLLTLSASGINALTATTNILLDIFKDDHVTPVFEKAVYNGIYNATTGLSLEEIIFIQGYDNNIDVVLNGDQADLFNLQREGSTIALGGNIPAEIWSLQTLILTLRATKPRTVGANTVIEITLPSARQLNFEKSTYIGHMRNDTLIIEEIILSDGYSSDVEFKIAGERSNYFILSNADNILSLSVNTSLSEEFPCDDNFIVLTISASDLNAIETATTIILEILRGDTTTPIFNQPSYQGIYVNSTFIDIEDISLIQGYDDTVSFQLDGDHAEYFDIDVAEGSVKINVISTIPEDLIFDEKFLLFTVLATKDLTVGATAVVSVRFPTDMTEPTIMNFSQSTYVGSLIDDKFEITEDIILETGFRPGTKFNLHGDYGKYFSLTNTNNVITITMARPLTTDELEDVRFITFEIEAQRERAVTASTSLVIDVIRQNLVIFPIFEKPFYTGNFGTEDGLRFEEEMRLAIGFDLTVTFTLEGEYSEWFNLKHVSSNKIGLSLNGEGLPQDIDQTHLIFSIVATKENNVTGRSAIVISLTDFLANRSLRFAQEHYRGSIKEGVLNVDIITLEKGYSEEVRFSLTGDYNDYFQINNKDGNITLTKKSDLPSEISEKYNILILTIKARINSLISGTTVILEILKSTVNDTDHGIEFEDAYYTGSYTESSGLTFDSVINVLSVLNGSINFSLQGEKSIWFGLERRSENSVSLVLRSPIPPEVIVNIRKLIFVITAARSANEMARATVIISLNDDSSSVPSVTFDKILYNGFIRLGNVMHESIEISGFVGTTIEIIGEYAELFEANLSDEVIVITTRPSAIFPNVSNIALVLRAGSARAVLVLNILESDTPVFPTVNFDSPSYVLRADLSHTGSIGQVQATSDNGETIRYSLVIDTDDLQERLSISNEGELRLSAPLNTGMYSFQAVATTVITQASATAPVHLSIEATLICGDDIVVPPLIILDRDEESPHRNLVVLNKTGCEYSLTNIWPKEQAWLYVDKEGLHATAIDREHESIAFMALSQIQVELILRCEGDVPSRTKRSLRLKSTAEFEPYEYGSNKWILTDTIRYNARRSLVNLIVNDINDNVPIFVGQDPIVVGYPTPELEAIILPRALLELKATDADIGENAAIVYWSSHESLAVSPSTGFVHIRNSSNLQNNARFSVHATDLNGAGHTSDVEIMVKLLDVNRIAVLNIGNAFLEDEEHILSNISETAGYDVKALRTVVVSTQTTRNMRDSSRDSAATLRLFVYGLIEQEPVDIKQLIADINNDMVTVNVASVISLEDHLRNTEICILPGRDNGLLAATIALSVLLFIIIVAVAVWLFLIWRKSKNYEQFSNRTSMASRNDLVEDPKAENPKPRLNIEDLKRSERKLQERLDAPVADVPAESTSTENPMEAIINISTPDPQLPIIIQTIDKLKDNTEESEDDDEFGEKLKSRRKSVVTFNENVEKIIHVEEDPNNSIDDYEIFRL